MKNEFLKVKLGEYSYPIFIEEDAIEKINDKIDDIGTFSNVIIITDDNVAKLHLKNLEDNFKKVKRNFHKVVLPSGEKTKSFKYLQYLLDNILSFKINRQCLLLAFGGGVIGDIVGLASSLILRGLPYIQIPTTLLSQVDSSVGGKTGINSKYGKNLIGTFKQPLAVISSINILKTLQKREINSGYAEIVKSALIKDKDFFFWLKDNATKILNLEYDECTYAVKKSCEIKSNIVALDEKESGIRALLNLGHTFGHAVENFTNYSNKIKHGEAVLIGIMMAIKMSIKLNFCNSEILKEFENHLKNLNLKKHLNDFNITINPKIFFDLIGFDKKVRDNKKHFILLEDIGKAFIYNSVTNEFLKSFLEKELN